jgi:hypothetical protein
MLSFTIAWKEDIYSKVVLQISLDNLIPNEHFYCWLANILDQQFLYVANRKHYGAQGQKNFVFRILSYDLLDWIFRKFDFR